MGTLLDLASLVVVPSGYKAGTVYSVKPTDGTGDLSFTRSNDTATRVNSAGLIEKVRTNLVLYSEDFDNASWGKINTSVTANQILSPNGTLTADLIDSGTASGTHFILGQAFTFANATTYTFSVYAKKGNTPLIQLFAGSSVFGANVWATYNFDTLEVTEGSLATASMTDVGNGWYRLTLTGTSTASALIAVIYIAFTNDKSVRLPLFTASNETVYVWGAQTELSDFGATDYIPTTTTAVSVGMTANVPRLDYSGGGCPKLLLEPQRTNLVTYSEQFDNAAWTKEDSTTISANATTAPDGYLGADKIIASSASGRQSINQTSTETGNLAISVFAKAGEYDVLQITDGRNPTFFANFDLNNGVLGSATGFVSKIESYASGWYKCTVTNNYNALSVANVRFSIAETPTQGRLVNFSGNGSDGLFIWGAQLEAGSYATSYIPTLGASVTRGADACSKTGISSLIGQTEGTVFFDANFDDSDTVNFSISDGTSSNYVLIDTTSARSVFARVQQGGVTQVQISTTSSFYSVGTRLKCAIAYKSNDFAFYINGTSIGTDNLGSVPALDQLRFARWNGSLAATQRINQTLLFPTRLTNTQLAELTTL